MLPGLLTTPDVWDDVIAALGPDLGGHCLPMVCPPLETVEAIADAIAADAPTLFHLVSFSFGGYVSLAMLERNPERIASLTLIGSASHADNDAVRAFRQQCIDEVEGGAVRFLAERLTANALHKAHLANSPMFRRAIQMATDYGTGRFIAHLRACMTRPDRTGLLASAASPVCFISGADDITVPLKLQRCSAEEAGTSLITISQAAHFVPLERPKQLGAILRAFIEESLPLRKRIN
jgi:pimeloyl-ACP methyl ester carboxylesterase